MLTPILFLSLLFSPPTADGSFLSTPSSSSPEYQPSRSSYLHCTRSYAVLQAVKFSQTAVAKKTDSFHKPMLFPMDRLVRRGIQPRSGENNRLQFPHGHGKSTEVNLASWREWWNDQVRRHPFRPFQFISLIRAFDVEHWALNYAYHLLDGEDLSEAEKIPVVVFGEAMGAQNLNLGKWAAATGEWGSTKGLHVHAAYTLSRVYPLTFFNLPDALLEMGVGRSSNSESTTTTPTEGSWTLTIALDGKNNYFLRPFLELVDEERREKLLEIRKDEDEKRKTAEEQEHHQLSWWHQQSMGFVRQFFEPVLAMVSEDAITEEEGIGVETRVVYVVSPQTPDAEISSSRCECHTSRTHAEQTRCTICDSTSCMLYVSGPRLHLLWFTITCCP